MTTERDEACERSVAQLPVPSSRGGSALGLWACLCGWFLLTGLVAMGLGLILAGSGSAFELAIWVALAAVSVACWLGFRGLARQMPPFRWRMSSLEAGIGATTIGVCAGLLLRGPDSVAAFVSMATLIVAAFSEEFIFRWVPSELTRRCGGNARMHGAVAVISALLFLSLHDLSHPALVVEKIAFSLASYYLCVYSGAVWLSWMAHLLTNSAAILVFDVSLSVSGEWVFVGLSVLAVGTMLLVSRRLGDRGDRLG